LGRITDKDGGYSDYQASITVSDAPVGPMTITPQVNSSSDDVNENGSSFQATNPTVWVGTNPSYTGLRFNNLGIPAGATISEAHLEFYVQNGQWIIVDVLIAAEAADNSMTFSSASRPSSRPLTTNRIEHHSNVSWPTNTWNILTGNLSGVVQEVVSRPGWQSGNSLSIIVKGIGSPFGRKFVTSYDGNPAFAPRLVIQYTVPSAPPPLLVPPPVPVIVPTPPTAAFTSDVTAGVAPLTVTFSNLSTGDIAGYAWDFGDGGSSIDANPSHPYTAEGTYTVTLTVTGVDSTTSMAQTIITVTAPEPPVIQIAPPPIEDVLPPPTEEVSATTTDPLPEATAAP
jgi:PKD repeat protein